MPVWPMRQTVLAESRPVRRSCSSVWASVPAAFGIKAPIRQAVSGKEQMIKESFYLYSYSCPPVNWEIQASTSSSTVRLIS